MAIAINASLSKKIQLPGHDYASQQASITITGEVTDLTKVGDEAARLLKLAESAVDAQLHLTASKAITTEPTHSAPISASNSRPSTSALAPNATRAYPRTGRKVALISPAQLGLIDRLLHETNTDANAVMLHYQVSSLDQMTCKNSSALIDELKARQTSTRP
jgi:hypothetical protein